MNKPAKPVNQPMDQPVNQSMKSIHKPASLKTVMVMVLFGAILYNAKLILAPLPNIEPVSLLVMLYSVCFGWNAVIAIGIYIFLECITFGFQIYVLSYLYVWWIAFFLARTFRNMTSGLGWAVLNGFFGLFFGFFCSWIYWITGSFSFGLSWWIAGIPFDLIHAFGNFVLAFLLFNRMRSFLEKLAQKLYA